MGRCKSLRSCCGCSQLDYDSADRVAFCRDSLACPAVVGRLLWNRCRPRPIQDAGDGIYCACGGALLAAAPPFVVLDVSNFRESQQNVDF